ncbi:4-hydroxythreonine-4-phosphate dehydrogenase PdxA [candidate division KSB1 bacterium]|nr:4-hydroxythreonine-4-phosphate dehydrogenase PdxA [candidate division KSB1 bacterium]
MATQIYITMGDLNGIGPEVTIKAISELFPSQNVVFTIVGSGKALEFYSRTLSAKLTIEEGQPGSDPLKLHFLEVDSEDMNTIEPGLVKAEAGKASVQFIQKALTLIENNDKAALVTAPISKQAIWAAGIDFPGHTELLADWFNTENYTMMLISNELKVGLVTTHHPIRDVSDLLSSDLIMKKCMTINRDLQNRFQIRNPRIALAGLNPHAGENGQLGTEEEKIIKPAIEKLKQQNVFVEGPFSSDTLFIPQKLQQYHAILAMYHDQGMIPVKMQGFGKAVNYTAGLPIVRTSPDHGTAFDIAGKGLANPSSMIEAIKLAITLAG